MANDNGRPRGNPPAYIARARQGEGSEYLTTIGAAFAFKEGDGLVVKLQFVPTNLKDGMSFILVPPQRDDDQR